MSQPELRPEVVEFGKLMSKLLAEDEKQNAVTYDNPKVRFHDLGYGAQTELAQLNDALMAGRFNEVRYHAARMANFGLMLEWKARNGS